jgi:hypothetical protein
VVRLFVGADWAESNHDIELMDAAGRRMARARLSEGVAGMERLHAMVAEQIGEVGDQDVEVAVAACRQLCDEVNDRVHRGTRRRPVDRLAEEQARLHLLPEQPFTVAFGTTRRVNWNATISVEGVRDSVPHELIDTRIWARS